MANSIRLSSATTVKARIAEAILGPSLPELRVGTVTLWPHQANAVTRLRSAINLFGGALLCDDVGMGKTFVAAAIAQDYQHPVIVAPAAIKTMWHQAMERTGLHAEFVSFERLSRQPVQAATYDLVIVDEAHHARTPSTRRYSALAVLTRDNRVLLMSATPIHNRERDLLALFALFLGGRAKSLTAEEKSRCIIRRERGSLQTGSDLPKVAPTVCHELPDDPSVVDDLLAIPTPVPVRDASPERHLFARGMIHQWASSEAALFEAIRRRRARGHALIASLESGVLPTANELATWVYGEGTLQLGFAELLSEVVAQPWDLLGAARDHLNALEAFTSTHSPGAIDEARVQALRAIRIRHPGARIVAFAQYAETITALYRRLAPSGGVAMLTAKGARISTGTIPRDEVVSQFQPGAQKGQRVTHVDMLLSTDLLSEGVNLQAAQVVIHLDLPWTAARLEQRTGRVARIGSPHDTVRVYTIRSPASARHYLESENIISAKWGTANSAIGSSTSDPFAFDRDHHQRRSIPAETEHFRVLLERWVSIHPVIQRSQGPVVASVESPTTGFIAALRSKNGGLVVCGSEKGVAADLQTLIATCSSANGREIPTQTVVAEAALCTIEEWIVSERASEIAGLPTTSELVCRRRLLERIDAEVRDAAPHLRPARTRLAVAARAAATRSLSVAAEHELESLEGSALAPDEWLQAVADFSPVQPEQFKDGESSRPEIIAVLLLTPPPPASGCGAV